MEFLQSAAFYLFYPNPGNASWDSPKALILAGVCLLMVIAAYALRVWRRRLQNPVTKKLSRSWASASFWFGVTGLLLVASRVNTIQFLSMRILWVVWGVLLILYVVVQVRIFRARHYVMISPTRPDDPRSKYLPKR